MRIALWIALGWLAFSVLMTLAYALGAAIGYRRGREDATATRAEDRPAIRLPEEEPSSRRHAS